MERTYRPAEMKVAALTEFRTDYASVVSRCMRIAEHYAALCREDGVPFSCEHVITHIGAEAEAEGDAYKVKFQEWLNATVFGMCLRDMEIREVRALLAIKSDEEEQAK